MSDTVPVRRCGFMAFAKAYLVFFVLVAAALASAQGGPPLITDDPGTPGNKHWEINIAFTESRYNSGTLYELPHIDLNYGYGDNLQLKLEGPLSIYNGEDRVDYTSWGYSNFGVKWRFQNDTKTHPALSTYPQIIVSTNQRLGELGAYDPGTDVFLPIEVMKSFGLLQLDTEVGVLFRQFTDTQYWGGVCSEYDLTKTFALLGEVHLIETSAYSEDQIVWNLGFKMDINEDHSILFSAGRTFASPGDDNPAFLLYAGVQVRT